MKQQKYDGFFTFNTLKYTKYAIFLGAILQLALSGIYNDALMLGDIAGITALFTFLSVLVGLVTLFNVININKKCGLSSFVKFWVTAPLTIYLAVLYLTNFMSSIEQNNELEISDISSVFVVFAIVVVTFSIAIVLSILEFKKRKSNGSLK